MLRLELGGSGLQPMPPGAHQLQIRAELGIHLHESQAVKNRERGLPEELRMHNGGAPGEPPAEPAQRPMASLGDRLEGLKSGS